MNQKQKKELDEIFSKLEEIEERLSAMRDEEEEKYENLSEGLQQSEKGQAIESAKNALDEACTHISDCKNSVEEARDA